MSKGWAALSVSGTICHTWLPGGTAAAVTLQAKEHGSSPFILWLCLLQKGLEQRPEVPALLGMHDILIMQYDAVIYILEKHTIEIFF